MLDCARHSETEEWMVIYRPCYGEAGLWVRPAGMFSESVMTVDGEELPRFERIGD
ncbi:DUF1653 domain-containing protein [Nitrincola sp. A-D6]|uniref:DUF1653 domain-containing protein n=1 Tax=Nitrincola sp. A-D6 TaxID=1545442 RepID=UPI002E0F645B